MEDDTQEFAFRDNEDNREVICSSFEDTIEDKQSTVPNKGISSKPDDDVGAATMCKESVEIIQENRSCSKMTATTASQSPSESVREEKQDLPEIHKKMSESKPLPVLCAVQQPFVKSTRRGDVFTDHDQRLVPKLTRNSRRA